MCRWLRLVVLVSQAAVLVGGAVGCQANPFKSAWATIYGEDNPKTGSELKSYRQADPNASSLGVSSRSREIERSLGVE